MNWQQIKITTIGEHADAVSDWLLEHGAVSVSLQDAEDAPIYEPPLNTTPLWPVVQVLGLFSEDVGVATLIQSLILENIFSLLSPPELDIFPDEDWVKKSLKDFKPIFIAKNLWICPSWIPMQDPDAVVVTLDPGLAFGTGSHPTTALMLEFLATHPPKNKVVIDYGCGSGILAIACAKLGAQQVVGVDIDPQALIATRDNAKRNLVFIDTYAPQDMPSLQADMIVANILLQPLQALKSTFLSLLKPQGQFIVSGILKSQAEILIKHYQPEMELIVYAEKQDWVLMTKKDFLF